MKIEVRRNEIAKQITVVVSVTKAMRSLRVRFWFANILFVIGATLIGCNLEIKSEGVDK